jgi:hemerythrin
MDHRVLVSFDRSLETGDPEIDAQHREIFSRIGRLLDVAKDQRARDEVARLLTFLGDYVVSHFGAEERLMEASGYPSAAAHRAEHRALMDTYGRLYQEFHADGPTLRFLLRFEDRVTAWLRDHIHCTDRSLADFLQSESRK